MEKLVKTSAAVSTSPATLSATSLIILLGKLRDKCHTRFIRFDRTLPIVKDHQPYLYISCCDCGLTHFFVPDLAGTPLRPRKYAYRMRFGANGWTKPDIQLGQKVAEHAIQFGIVREEDLIMEQTDG